MSASTEKKSRIASIQAGTNKKALAAQKEAAKAAESRRKWTIGTIAVVLGIALILLLDSAFLYKTLTAVDVNGRKYTPAEMGYHYSTQYSSFATQYGNYTSMFGLDTSNGITGLRTQDCPMLDEGGTWRDYFIDAAVNEICQTQALCDYAAANGVALSEEEKADIAADVASLPDYVKAYGYPNANKFLSANYGVGVNTKLVEKAATESALANAAYSHKYDSLQYTDEELAAQYDSYNGEQDTVKYGYYFISAPEGGDVSFEQANEKAEQIKAAYDKAEGDDPAAKLNAAIASVDEGASASLNMGSVASVSVVYADWLKEEHKAGDLTIVSNDSSTGVYVVLFLDRNDNRYPLAQVRHILIKAVADENGEYTDAAKAEAKAQAEALLNEWKSGAATEESFAELATAHSQDEGSAANGGLYDSVIKGQMVDGFDEFCFAGHRSGDTAIVYGEGGDYAGYHVMYYVGEGELYSNSIARSDLVSSSMSAWLDELLAGYDYTVKKGMNLVG